MKRIVPVLLLLLFLSLASCQSNVLIVENTPGIPEAAEKIPPLDWEKLPTQLPKSLKGYELVSWQAGEDWNFTLITGTNREKTFEELISPESSVTDDGFVKLTVSGIAEIKRALALLPTGEEVIWTGINLAGEIPEGAVYFTYPTEELKEEIISHCEELGIILYTP